MGELTETRPANPVGRVRFLHHPEVQDRHGGGNHTRRFGVFASSWYRCRRVRGGLRGGRFRPGDEPGAVLDGRIVRLREPWRLRHLLLLRRVRGQLHHRAGPARRYDRGPGGDVPLLLGRRGLQGEPDLQDGAGEILRPPPGHRHGVGWPVLPGVCGVDLRNGVTYCIVGNFHYLCGIIAVIVCEISAMLKGLGEASVSPFACRSFHDVLRAFRPGPRNRPHGATEGVIPYPLGETALNRKENGPTTVVAVRRPPSRRTGSPPGGGSRPGPRPVGRPPVLRFPGFLYLRAGNPSSFGVCYEDSISVFIVC